MMAHCPTAASDDPNAPRLIPAGSPVYVRMLNDQGRAKRAVFDEPVEGGLTTRTIKGETYRMAVLFLPGAATRPWPIPSRRARSTPAAPP